MPNTQKEPRKINRVCFLNPHGYVMYPPPLGKTDTGGQTIYEFQLAQALGKRNIKVDIITRQFDDYPAEEQVFENVKIVRIPCGPKGFVPKEKMYELIPEMTDNFMAYIDKSRKKYDIVHSHYWDGGYMGILVSKMLDLPHIHTPHSLGKLKRVEMSVEELSPQKLKPAYRYHVRIALEQRIYSSADAMTVLCETSRIQMLQYYLVDFEKIHVIFPGINIETYNPIKTADDKKIKFAPNSILTMCRLVPPKGIDRLVDALALIKNRVDFHVYMGGASALENKGKEEMEQEETVKSLLKKYRLEDRTTFLGYVDHESILPTFYRGADIFVNPARFEPFGLTTLEAMACGTAPVISRVAGSREVIVDGLNGFIADTHDRKSFSQLLLKLFEDTKLRKKVAENAAFTIKEHYSWDKIVEKFITLYKQI